MVDLYTDTDLLDLERRGIISATLLLLVKDIRISRLQERVKELEEQAEELRALLLAEIFKDKQKK